MTKILTGGVGKSEVASAVTELRLPGVEVVVSNDMDAAMQLRAGQADYFLGSCHTGAGASLGVLVGLMGAAACHTFGRTVPTAEQIEALLGEGRTVFGFALDRIETVAPALARAIAVRTA
ncbi:DUF2620 domain-containing protein [Streptomyces sp. NPDC053427]|uniref:DUF2620 domain-containing protein n=1 Tax=Streptomyces sp. NPDC053427 TaxID=3365701 RepID=UPI0037D3C112